MVHSARQNRLTQAFAAALASLLVWSGAFDSAQAQSPGDAVVPAPNVRPSPKKRTIVDSGAYVAAREAAIAEIRGMLTPDETFFAGETLAKLEREARVEYANGRTEKFEALDD